MHSHVLKNKFLPVQTGRRKAKNHSLCMQRCRSSTPVEECKSTWCFNNVIMQILRPGDDDPKVEGVSPKLEKENPPRIFVNPRMQHKFKYICQTVRRLLWMLKSARAAT
jgi:hypothetical protein